MTYHITHTKTNRKEQSNGCLFGIPIIILCFPFILLIVGIILIIEFTRDKTNKHKEEENNDTIWKLNHDKLSITLTPKFDNILDDYWYKNVDAEIQDPYLHTFQSTPIIASLEDAIIGDFYIANEKGVFLHLVNLTNTEQKFTLDSTLIFIDFNTLEVSKIADIGPYILYTKGEDYINTFYGYNHEEEITFTIKNEL